MHLTLQEWSAIAQIGVMVVALIGVGVSFVTAIRAIREVQIDRRVRQRPYLAFECGGWHLRVHFVKAGGSVPGVDPVYAKQVFADVKADDESVRLLEQKADGGVKPLFYGQLKNFGMGPALQTKVVWTVDVLKIGREVFRLDSGKLSEPRYSRAMNELPTWKQHILPGDHSSLTRLPTFIEKDTDKKITEAHGLLLITAKDVFGSTHVTRQAYHLFTGYADSEPYVHVTFSSIVDNGG